MGVSANVHQRGRTLATDATDSRPRRPRRARPILVHVDLGALIRRHPRGGAQQLVLLWILAERPAAEDHGLPAVRQERARQGLVDRERNGRDGDDLEARADEQPRQRLGRILADVENWFERLPPSPLDACANTPVIRYLDEEEAARPQ